MRQRSGRDGGYIEDSQYGCPRIAPHDPIVCSYAHNGSHRDDPCSRMEHSFAGRDCPDCFTTDRTMAAH